jgi:hypothetical protein
VSIVIVQERVEDVKMAKNEFVLTRRTSREEASVAFILFITEQMEKTNFGSV